MRYYLQHLTVLTIISLIIIFSYIYVAFAPQSTNSNRAEQAITTSCSEDIFTLEVAGIASIADRYLRETAHEKIRTVAYEICESAQLFADDPASKGTALFPFHLAAHAEYHTYETYRGIRIQFYSDTGGAHGNINYYTETTSSRKGTVSLPNLLAERNITEDAFIKAAVTELESQGDIAFLTPLTSLEQVEHWHITDRGMLLVTFPPFALAPYTYGTLEVSIDLNTVPAQETAET